MNFSKAVFENLISLFKKEQAFNFLFQADIRKVIKEIKPKYSDKVILQKGDVIN